MKSLRQKLLKTLVTLMVLSVFAATISVVIADENADMLVTPTEVSLQINQGDSESIQLTVHNKDEENLLRNVSLSVNKYQSWFSFDRQNFDVAPNGYEYVNPTVTIPSNTSRGTYKATITLHSDNGGTRYVDFTIEIKGAKLYVSNDTIVKENMASTVTEDIPIKNIGSATLKNVQLKASPSISDYLKFSKNGFDVNTGATVIVTATITPPTGSGVFSGTINILSNNGGSHLIKVTLSKEGTILKVSPESISMKMQQAESSTATISLESLSLSSLNVTIEKSGAVSDWIKLSRNSTILAPFGYQTISVKITIPDTVSDGTYTGTIIVYSEGGGSKSIPVQVVVGCRGFNIKITTPDLNLELSSGSVHKEFLELENTGCQRLDNVQIEASGRDIGDWINFENNGFSIGPSGTMSVKANLNIPSDALTGTYQGKITVTGSSDGFDVSDTIDVTIEVGKSPILKVVPADLGVIKTYPAVTTPKTLCIENTGDSVLKGVNLEVQGSLKDWIKFDHQDFSVKSKESKCVVMKVTPSENAVLKEYTDSLLITADNGEYVTLDLVVKVVPPIGNFIVKPSSLNLFVASGSTEAGTLELTDLSTDTKQVYFNLIGDIASKNLMTLASYDAIFSGSDRTKELSYTITIPSTFNGVSEGAIILSGEVDLEIPVTLSTNVSEKSKIKQRVISIPDQSVNPSDIIDVPINMKKAENVGAIDLIVNYDPAVLTATNVKNGSLTTNSIIAYNLNSSGTIMISTVDAKGFSGDGSLAIMTFKVIGNDGDISPLTLSSVAVTDVNFQSIKVTTDDGRVVVSGKKIAETIVSVSDTQANTGDQIDIPINITNALKVGSMDIDFVYDPDVLSVVSVNKGTLTSNSMLQTNTATEGVIKIGIIDSSGINGNGSIAVINFKVIGKDGDTSKLDLSNVEVSDVNATWIPVTTEDATFTVGVSKCGITGDLNGDAKVTSVDALMALQMAVGNLQVNNCADVNGDGKVTSVDALMILQASVGNIKL